MSNLWKSRKFVTAFWTCLLNILLALLAFFLKPQYPDIYQLLFAILASIDALAAILIGSIALEDFGAKRAGMAFVNGHYEYVCPCDD